MKKKYVIALGGSILCPDDINVGYLKNFHSLLMEKKEEASFVVIVGGGGVSRKYQKAASEFECISNDQLDEVGISATKLNAKLVKSVFGEDAHPQIFDERGKITDFKDYTVVVGSGWSAGWSTDYVAMQIAVDMDIDNVIILGKPKYVYSSDPEKENDAKPIEDISWEEYLGIIPHQWSPGMNLPVDPVASKLALKERKTVYLTNGEGTTNLRDILENKKFIGTTLHP